MGSFCAISSKIISAARLRPAAVFNPPTVMQFGAARMACRRFKYCFLPPVLLSMAANTTRRIASNSISNSLFSIVITVVTGLRGAQSARHNLAHKYVLSLNQSSFHSCAAGFA